MKLRSRGASSAPASAAETVLGMEPVDKEAPARFSNLRPAGAMGQPGAACGDFSRRPYSLGQQGQRFTSVRVWGSEQIMPP